MARPPAAFPDGEIGPRRSASIRVHPRPFAVPPPQRQGRCGIKPGVAPGRRYPGFRANPVPYPARGCAVRAHGRCCEQGRNGIRFTGAEEESARNVCPLSTKYPHLTCHPFEPSAQPRWGCLCLWTLPRVAPRRRNPGLYGRIPLGFPEGRWATCNLGDSRRGNARAHTPLGFPNGEGGWVTVSRPNDNCCKGREPIYPTRIHDGNLWPPPPQNVYFDGIHRRGFIAQRSGDAEVLNPFSPLLSPSARGFPLGLDLFGDPRNRSQARHGGLLRVLKPGPADERTKPNPESVLPRRLQIPSRGGDHGTADGRGAESR